jgi:hypothetical protein
MARWAEANTYNCTNGYVIKIQRSILFDFSPESLSITMDSEDFLALLLRYVSGIGSSVSDSVINISLFSYLYQVQYNTRAIVIGT